MLNRSFAVKAVRLRRFQGRLVLRLPVFAALCTIAGCTFDSTVPDTSVHVPVVICDADASSTACTTAGQQMSWIAYFGNLEFMDGSLGTVPNQSTPIPGSSGCQHEGRLRIYPDLVGAVPLRLLALDEQDWVTDCSPTDLFSRNAGGELVINGTAVFRRGANGCTVRTVNFCN